nr:MAG TPA: hypothetical protein [Caudoviricetes sp.]
MAFSVLANGFLPSDFSRALSKLSKEDSDSLRPFLNCSLSIPSLIRRSSIICLLNYFFHLPQYLF